jgi:glycosyltransferase involved in cell wall biosynthesis
MAHRLKVLISAYACEPNKGSEPEIGWQWALQMARFHDVTVLTRANNRPAIEQTLEAVRQRQPVPSFVYHDCRKFILGAKRRFGAIKLYYLFWQRSAWHLIEELHKRHQFDLLHHTTFSSFRYPTAIWGHGIPCIWGPLGGMESVPARLLPWHHPTSFVHETFRNLSNFFQSAPFYVLPKRARATSLILAATREMQQALQTLGFSAELESSVGLRIGDLPYQSRQNHKGPLKLLFVGNIFTLKGIDLALEALKLSNTDAIFTLVGSGNYLSATQEKAKRLGLGARVIFAGRMPRERVLTLYPEYDAFLFPSLHDTGGYAVIEAMFNELPVICLDCGGPAVTVRNGCGVKVPLGPRAQIVADLAAAISRYDRDRKTMWAEGKNSREAVLKYLDWNQKGAEMSERYMATVAQRPLEAKSPALIETPG